MFNFFTSKKMTNSIVNIMSCVLSYIYLAIITYARVKIQKMEIIPDTPMGNAFVSIAIGTILSLVIAWIFSTKIFSKLTVFFFNKTPHNDIWRDVLDFRNGSNLKIYLKDKDYYIIGHHKNHEEKEQESWLAVSAYEKRNVDTNKPLENEPSHLNDESVIYTVRFSDIEHIEIF